MTNENPYAAPEFQSPRQGNPLKVPAIFLLVFAILFLVLWIVGLPMMVGIARSIDTSTPNGMGRFTGHVSVLGGIAASNLVIVLGSILMLRRRRHSLATLAAVIACIPICSPFYVVGIPFGIWAFVVLRRQDVRSSFS